MTNKEIKKAFQGEFPQFDFSVSTSRGGYSESINIMIKNFEALVTDSKTYKKVVSELNAFKDSLKIEKTFGDLGGNTYVNLGYKTETGTCLFSTWV